MRLGQAARESSITIHHLKGARHGVLRASGTVAHSSPRQAVGTATVEALAPDGTSVLCAIASGTPPARRASRAHLAIFTAGGADTELTRAAVRRPDVSIIDGPILCATGR